VRTSSSAASTFAHEIGRERLLDEVVRALAHRLDRRLDGAERRHHQHHHRGIVRLHPLRHLDAVEPVHLEVGDDDIGALHLEAGDALEAVAEAEHVVARLLERDERALPQRVVVVDDQHSRHG
jgi:hypothetical protein